jgi:ATP-dependent helicase/nuclease subunit A
VDASAGTGKTHVLSARVLRLMVEGAHPASILCLTYTKAAAGEMTNRILSHLGRWATLGEADLKAELSILLGGTSQVGGTQVARARQLFLDVLDLPMGLNVQTLHAFSQSLLGRFPIEANTAPGFETIDDRTAQELLGSSRDDVLAHAVAGQDPALSAAASALARQLADSSFNEMMTALKHQAATLGGLPRSRSALLAQVERALGLAPSQSDAQLVAAACQDSAFDAPGLRAVLDAITLYGTDAEKRAKCGPIADFLSADAANRSALFAAYAAVFLTTNGDKRKTLLTKGPAKQTPTGIDIMAKEAQRLLTVQEQRTLTQVAHQTADALFFGQALLSRYTARKDNAAKLDFSDLIDRTRALLETADVPTWVMYKLDTQIDHILIDEAQDNSVVQWRIIDRLTQDFFTTQDAERKRSVFAVGDMKQSIYGFQGAQPKLFDETRSRVRHQAAHVHQAFEDVPMAQSFRSVQAVLDVVDETFASDAGSGLDARNVKIKHRSFRRGVGGHVDLWPIMFSPKEDEKETGWRLPLHERSQTKADRALAQRIASDIHTRIAARECLPGRSTPVQAGDFLILVRQRGDFMGHMARALKRKGVPLAGIDRFDLKSPLVIGDLINIARFACLPGDDFTLACVLKSPFCGVSEEMLMQLCTQRSSTLWDHICKGSALPPSALKTLQDVLRRADYMPPYEFFSHILVHGGRTALLERLGEEVDDAIDVFLGQCLLYERSHVPSLDGFLHWFAQGDVDVKRDAEGAGDKVRIMTIHGSKGLQAPVVYLPDLVGLPKTKDRMIEVEQASTGPRIKIPIFRRSSAQDVGPVGAAMELQKAADYNEYKRLLYVAMTRAEDHLICCGFKNAKPKTSEKPAPKDNRKDAYTLIEEAFERMAALDNSPLETLDGIGQRYSQAQSAPLPAEMVGPARAPALAAKPSWLSQPAPAEATPPRPLQPSDTGLAPPALFDGEHDKDLTPAQRGTLVHALLEHLPAIPSQAREEKARAFLKASMPAATQDIRDALLRQSLETLSLAPLAPLFASGSRAEVPLVARLGDFMVSGQIDRLAIEGERVLFADYKTTASPPTSAADIAPAYLRQMALYHASLAQMFPGKEILGALVWTVTGRVDWLEPGSLLKHLPPSANSAFSAQ